MTLKDWAYNTATKAPLAVSSTCSPYLSRPSHRQSYREEQWKPDAERAYMISSCPTDAFVAHPRAQFHLPPKPGAPCTHKTVSPPDLPFLPSFSVSVFFSVSVYDTRVGSLLTGIVMMSDAMFTCTFVRGGIMVMQVWWGENGIIACEEEEEEERD
jgi:hypothetical protein